MMKMSKVLWIATLVALSVALVTPSFGQIVANDAYQVNYFANRFTTLRVLNTGQIGSPIDSGTNEGKVCADIYVFDANQEMVSCCSCPITANGLLSMNGNSLFSNSLTGVRPDTGVIKIVSDAQPGTSCDATTILSPVNAGLRSWETHLQGTNVFTETLSQTAPLTNTEAAFLGQACSFVVYLGSGRGTCICREVG